MSFPQVFEQSGHMWCTTQPSAVWTSSSRHVGFRSRFSPTPSHSSSTSALVLDLSMLSKLPLVCDVYEARGIPQHM